MELFNVGDIWTTVEIPEGTILLSYRGSIAHGMFVPPEDPNSIDDVDLMGIVIGSEDCYLGLKEWGSRGTREIKEGRYDCVFYEIRKAVSLLLQGNPNILGMLWTKTDHQLYGSPFGDELIWNRKLFVGKHVYNAFAGYAHAQLEKMETRERSCGATSPSPPS
jgi:predicted nucleotidyltransferase